MIGLRLAMSALALLAACSTPSSERVPAGPTPDAPQAKVGDYWEYAVRDGYTGIPHGVYRYEVVQSDAQRIVLQVMHDGASVNTLVYAPGWNGRELPVTALDSFRYDPALVEYVYPLQPGRRWRAQSAATDTRTGRQYTAYVIGRVRGWERVRVPAGEFDAIRVEREIFAGNMEGSRTQEEIRETDWYVPAVRRAVLTQRSSQHFDTSMGGGDGGGEYPLRVRGDWLIGELVAYSR